MAERIFSVESGEEGELILRFRRPSAVLLSAEAKGHLSSSAKEMMLGLRSFLDASIKVMEEREKKGRKPKTKIEVE